jgi:heat shock protein HtpX
MIGTLAIMIAVSTLFFSVVLSLFGGFNLFSLALFVIPVNIAQWLFAPYLINVMYGTRPLSTSDNPRLTNIVEDLSQKMGLRTPKIMLANLPISNAFAYGSPLTGNRIAVTSGLVRDLQTEEIEAVIGHELGHLKHRDVQVMMIASVLPAILYYLGYSMLFSARYSRGQREGNSGAAVLIGIGSMIFYWILNLLVLGLSRMREYYADQNSVKYVEDGAGKLSRALAKIATSTKRTRRYSASNIGVGSFKALFISDPDTAQRDAMVMAQSGMLGNDQQLVQEMVSRKISPLDTILELFSTHPNIVKRLRALQNPA